MTHCSDLKTDSLNCQPRAVSPTWTLLLALSLGSGMLPHSNAAPHRYDHVVIVVEENRTVGQIIGDRVNAPYINTLADGGVRLGSMFALVHPSQPNYINLFSGDNQGVINDSLPPNFSTVNTATYPFRTPNLGAEIIAAGFTFAGYSEQIEAAGAADWADYDPHTASDPGIFYRRRHNPWANWVAKVTPVPANQLTSTVNRAFTQFPSNNFAALPTVSFVVPNTMHDMHDGSRKQGDDWLRDNLGAYAVWAKTNNSLLIVTWDEDDYNSVNQIPTVFYGASLRDGTVTAGTWTSHNLLRTIEDMYGTSHAGSAAQVRSIIGPFTSDPAVTNVSFRQGLAGYAGAQDTQIWAETPSVSYAAIEDLAADLDTSSVIAGNQEGQVLVRFNSLFGSSAGQVPTNAVIQSAKLILFTPLSPAGADYDSDDTFRAHRMIVDWTDSATWDSLAGGVSTDNTEAANSATSSLIPEVDGAPAIFDVTSDIELFRTGTPNRGWLIRPSTIGTGNGWTFKSSEASADPTQRPTLEIIYTVPTPYAVWAGSNNLTGSDAEPTADPDGDGASNLTEFACNMNPLVADAFPITTNGTSGLPAAHYLPDSGGTLEVEFLRRKAPTGTGLTYVTQFSSNLVNWVNGKPPTVMQVDAIWQRTRIRDAVSGPNPQRFGRVVVTLQQ